MKPKDVLLERWAEILARQGDSPAILNAQGDVIRTFRQIERDARDFDAKLDGLLPGSVLAVQIGNDAHWPAILIACLRGELVVLPLEQSLNEQQRNAALVVCNAAGVVAAVPGGKLEIRPTRTPATIQWTKDVPMLMKLTSGTTAAPRAVCFRDEQLLADCDQICETMAISDIDFNFGVIPISHSYGFSNLLTPLLARGVPMVLSSDRTPRAVLNDLSRTNATVFPGTPVFYQAFCEMENVSKLSKLRLCISAGAPLPLTMAKKFREKFELTIHSFYGASECGGICYDREAKLNVEGFVGAPMSGVELEVIDSDSTSSQVRVRSAAVGDGYFPAKDEGRLSNGVFVPDDVLTREGDGFKIVGRISDVINVAGKKVNPLEIEQVLLQFHGVRQAMAFGRKSVFRNEEVVACVVSEGERSEKQLVEFCGKRLSAWQVPKRIFFVESIPTNERGKTSRKELAKRFSI